VRAGVLTERIYFLRESFVHEWILPDTKWKAAVGVVECAGSVFQDVSIQASTDVLASLCTTLGENASAGRPRWKLVVGAGRVMALASLLPGDLDSRAYKRRPLDIHLNDTVFGLDSVGKSISAVTAWQACGATIPTRGLRALEPHSLPVT